jgi:hypothetical protein
MPQGDNAGRPRAKVRNPKRLREEERLAESILAWSQESDAWFLASWMKRESMHRDGTHRLVADSEIFRDAYKKAKANIEQNLAIAIATDRIRQTAFGIFALKQPEHGGWKDKHDDIARTDSPTDRLPDHEIDEEIERLRNV